MKISHLEEIEKIEKEGYVFSGVYSRTVFAIRFQKVSAPGEHVLSCFYPTGELHTRTYDELGTMHRPRREGPAYEKFAKDGTVLDTVYHELEY